MAETSHTSDASLLAGVLAAVEAALPGKGLDLLVWGAARRGDQATLRYLLADDGEATWAFSKTLSDADKPGRNGESEAYQYSDSNRCHMRAEADLLTTVADDEDKAKTSFGASPLCFAAATGDPGVVMDVLLKAGVDASGTTGDDGAIPILVAAKAGHAGIVEKLLKAGADADKAAIDDGTTPLIEAILNGNADVVEQLLESGADVNKARTRDGSTPLLIASMKAREDIVEQLIHSGADLDKARTDDGTTPLLMASGQGDERIVEILLRAGANPNKARTDDGSTALGMAAMDRNEGIVKQLIKSGAWIMMDSGESVLTLAAWEGCIGVCSLLLEAGAHVSHVSTMGETPLRVAVGEGHKETALFLHQHGASFAGGIVDKSMRQKLAKWVVQEMMEKDGAMEERKKVRGAPKRSTTSPCLSRRNP